jgi:hypothetical protein
VTGVADLEADLRITIAVQELRDGMNRLRGNLFGAVEVLGLPVKRENAIKGLVRTLTYDAQANIEAALRRQEEPCQAPQLPLQD